jgi:membrane-bound ClpP family serine protease
LNHQAKNSWSWWVAFAKGTVVIGALHSIGDLSTRLSVAADYATMAFGDKFGQPTFTLLRNGTELEFSGGINYGLREQFDKVLAGAPQVKVVHLNSQGGRIADAHLIAKSIRERGLVTYVRNHCESACTDVFLAGRERWAAPTAEIGFHSPDFPGATDTDLQSVRQDELSYLTMQGVSKNFAEKAVSTKPESMWYPTGQEMLDARVLTGIANPGQFAASVNRWRFATTKQSRSTRQR